MWPLTGLFDQLGREIGFNCWPGRNDSEPSGNFRGWG